MNDRTIGWFGIVRLGLVQAALGGIVVLTTSTMNRVMVVELSLPAILPGALVAWHYCVQLLRPRLGHGSDVGGRGSPWIIGGMATLATGGIAAGVAIAWMKASLIAGVMLAIAAFTMIGIGVGAAGTALLVLLAKSVAPSRRAAAATIVWVMMIAGFAVTAGIAGHFLSPFSLARLIEVTSVAGVSAFLLTVVAIWRIEIGAAPGKAATPSVRPADRTAFREALRQVWAEPQARRFAIFVFVSMVAYSAQELVLEPFAGAVFGLTPGQSATLTSFQHGGALLGMLFVAVLGSVVGFARRGSMRAWTIGGCVASAAALLGLAVASFVGPAWPLRTSVFVLGAANGMFAVSAIGAMMGLAANGRQSREGVRMGLWGAAQAIAFAVGGLIGTGSSDIVRHLLGSPVGAYAAVFAGEAALFLLAAFQAGKVFEADAPGTRVSVAPAGGVPTPTG
jgi:MFS transporter, BCD family, chlorophyll transporter